MRSSSLTAKTNGDANKLKEIVVFHQIVQFTFKIDADIILLCAVHLQIIKLILHYIKIQEYMRNHVLRFKKRQWCCSPQRIVWSERKRGKNGGYQYPTAFLVPELEVAGLALMSTFKGFFSKFAT